jgi:uncharacterized membrane protein
MSETRIKDLSAYRQPMVTSLGIIMGFILNFLAGWATRDNATSEITGKADWIVAATLMVALALMVFVLYRLLDYRHQEEALERVYGNTLRLYMASIILAFCGVGLALFY